MQIVSMEDVLSRVREEKNSVQEIDMAEAIPVVEEDLKIVSPSVPIEFLKKKRTL